MSQTSNVRNSDPRMIVYSATEVEPKEPEVVYRCLLEAIVKLDATKDTFEPITVTIGPKAMFDEKYWFDRNETRYRSADFEDYNEAIHNDTGLYWFEAVPYRPDVQQWNGERPLKSTAISNQYLSDCIDRGADYDDLRSMWISIVLKNIEMSLSGRNRIERPQRLLFQPLIDQIRLGSQSKVAQLGHYSKLSTSVGLEGSKREDLVPTIDDFAAEIHNIAKCNPLYKIRFIEEPVPKLLEKYKAWDEGRLTPELCKKIGHQ